ncbi:unnamed protein product [Caenorhabditis angaria]|uniref:Piwi domain-containing protein n=1 Tax=Caenorhabditis angaria TaxID=860376 RepID=A0A9P1IRR1_9PELO|nr:unnamed protein product [Caenorhabditis angaria]
MIFRWISKKMLFGTDCSKFVETNRNRMSDKIVILRDGISDSEMLKFLRNEVTILMRNRENPAENEPE